MNPLFKIAACAAAVLGNALAHAGITYSAATIQSGLASGATFTATGGALVLKNQYGVQGVGVSGGRTADEIDIGEAITAKFASAVHVDAFQLAFLYDGPEFKDVQEKAQVTVMFADLTQKAFSLTANYPDSYAWTGLGSVSNPHPNIDSKGGFWTVSNPFGDASIKGLSFTALQGVCGRGLSCDNQSDFGLASITVSPVPEPATYTLALVGLAAIGFSARRRKSR